MASTDKTEYGDVPDLSTLVPPNPYGSGQQPRPRMGDPLTRPPRQVQ